MTAEINQPSVSLSGTTSSSRVAYPGPQASRKNGVWVYNSGSVVVFMKSGDENVVATSSDSPVPPASTRFFRKNIGDSNIATITASSTATVYVQEEPFF